MKTMTKLTLVITGLLVAGTALVGFGAHSMEPEEHAQWWVKKLTRELELDAVQVEKLETLKETLLQARAEMHENHDAQKDEVIAMLSAPVIDRNQLNEIVSAKTQRVSMIAPEIITVFADFYDSLADAQKQEVVKHVSEKMRHAGRHDHW